MLGVIGFICLIFVISIFANSNKKEEQEIGSLKISCKDDNLIPGEKQIFQVKGFDKSGAEINPGSVTWTATGGTISDRGELTVNANTKGKFTVTVATVNRKNKAVKSYTVSPRLSSIQIEPGRDKILPGRTIQLKLIGLDQTGEIITIQEQVIWHTNIGEIDSNGKLVVEIPNQFAIVTAQVRGFKAESRIEVGEDTVKAKRSSDNYRLPENPSIIINNSVTNLVQKTKTSFSSTPRIKNYDQHQKEIKIQPFQINSESSNSFSLSSYHDELSIEKYSTIDDIQTVVNSRLVALEIEPTFVALVPDQEQIFTVYGIDQFRQRISPGIVKWQATGGIIDDYGKLKVNPDAHGQFKVTAISVDSKTYQRHLARTLLSIKVSLTIFSWILSQRKLITDIFVYTVKEFSTSLELEELENLLDTDEINPFSLLVLEKIFTLLTEHVKETIIKTLVNIIVDYIYRFIFLCFKEQYDPLICYSIYIVLYQARLNNYDIGEDNAEGRGQRTEGNNQRSGSNFITSIPSKLILPQPRKEYQKNYLDDDEADDDETESEVPSPAEDSQPSDTTDNHHDESQTATEPEVTSPAEDSQPSDTTDNHHDESQTATEPEVASPAEDSQPSDTTDNDHDESQTATKPEVASPAEGSRPSDTTKNHHSRSRAAIKPSGLSLSNKSQRSDTINNHYDESQTATEPEDLSPSSSDSQPSDSNNKRHNHSGAAIKWEVASNFCIPRPDDIFQNSTGRKTRVSLLLDASQFCKSQLFYDGYSFEEYLEFEGEQEYIDSIDYYHYIYDRYS